MKKDLLIAAGLWLVIAPASAADNPVSPDSADQVIRPEIDRRDITVPKIRARDFEWNLFFGEYSAEAFDTQLVYGARIGYHVSEDFFVEFTYGQSTIADTNWRTSGIPQFTDEITPLSYYHLSAGVNLFPGEIFLGRGRAWGSAVYLVGGVGSTKFDVFDRITMNVGGGLRVLLSKTFSVRAELREHLYESDVLGENKFMRNHELTFGLSGLF